MNRRSFFSSLAKGALCAATAIYSPRLLTSNVVEEWQSITVVGEDQWGVPVHETLTFASLPRGRSWFYDYWVNEKGRGSEDRPAMNRAH